MDQILSGITGPFFIVNSLNPLITMKNIKLIAFKFWNVINGPCSGHSLSIDSLIKFKLAGIVDNHEIKAQFDFGLDWITFKVTCVWLLEKLPIYL